MTVECNLRLDDMLQAHVAGARARGHGTTVCSSRDVFVRIIVVCTSAIIARTSTMSAANVPDGTCGNDTDVEFFGQHFPSRLIIIKLYMLYVIAMKRKNGLMVIFSYLKMY